MLKDTSKSRLVAVPVLLTLIVYLGLRAKGNNLVSAILVVLLMSLAGLLMGIMSEVEVKTQMMVRMVFEVVVVVLLCWAEVEAVRRLELVLAVLLLLPLAAVGAAVCDDVADATRERQDGGSGPQS
jgi:hypothetical protein